MPKPRYPFEYMPLLTNGIKRSFYQLPKFLRLMVDSLIRANLKLIGSQFSSN